MEIPQYKLMLADDDSDDCLFFKEALEDLKISAQLKTVKDGAELMYTLMTEIDRLPDVLFLDLNMPKKTGIECLSEIKVKDEFKHLPIIIFSTSLDLTVVNSLYDKGAHYYIRKPGEFSKLKKVIKKALAATTQSPLRPTRERFILHS